MTEQRFENLISGKAGEELLILLLGSVVTRKKINPCFSTQVSTPDCYPTIHVITEYEAKLWQYYYMT